MRRNRFVLIAVFATAIFCFLWLKRKTAETTAPFSKWVTRDAHLGGLLFSPDDRRFSVLVHDVAPDEDTRLLVIDRRDGRVLHQDDVPFVEIRCFSKDSTHFAYAAGLELVVVDLDDQKQILRLDRITNSIDCLGFSRDKKSLVIARHPGESPADAPEQVVSIADGNVVDDNMDSPFVYGRALAGSGITPERTKWFAGGWPGPTPRVFHWNGESICYCYRSPNISDAFFAPDGKRLVTIHTDAAVLLWKLTGKVDGGGEIIDQRTYSDLKRSKDWTMLNQELALAYINENGRLKKLPLFQDET